MKLYNYFAQNINEILERGLQHIELTLLAIIIAILVGIPLGILVSYIKPLNKPVIGFANLIQAIPSIAILGFMVPVFGIGEKPAVAMVVLYSLLPIIKNTSTGLLSINNDLLEAAKGIGMTNFQILIKVRLPLAMPVIMTGVRISAVTSVGLVTIAAFIGAGGLGYLIYSGIRTVNTLRILAGAIPACILALAVDWIGSKSEKLVTPACFKQ